MKQTKSYHEILLVRGVFILMLVVCFCSCKKLIEIEPPKTSINQDNVYTSDNTAIAALTSIYATMGSFNEFTGNNSISVHSGLSSDELTLYSAVSDNKFNAYYKNKLVSRPLENYGTEFWLSLYNYVFRCNAAIEGLTVSTT